MRIRLLPEAVAYLRERDAGAVTVESFVVAGCCSPDLPPVVRIGPPRDAEGFRRVDADGCTVYVDPLLEPPALLTIGLRRHLLGGAELAVVDQEGTAPPAGD